MLQNNKDQKYLSFLQNVAKETNSGMRCRLAAMLVHRQIPVALGTNKMKTHPLQVRFARNKHTINLHAEIDALIKAVKILDKAKLKECTLYVARVLKNGDCALAKPCSGCQEALIKFGIARVVWTTDFGFRTSDEERLNENNSLQQNRQIT